MYNQLFLCCFADVVSLKLYVTISSPSFSKVQVVRGLPRTTFRKHSSIPHLEYFSDKIDHYTSRHTLHSLSQCLLCSIWVVSTFEKQTIHWVDITVVSSFDSISIVWSSIRLMASAICLHSTINSWFGIITGSFYQKNSYFSSKQ